MNGTNFINGFVWGAGFTVAWVVIHILLRVIGVAAA